MNMNSLKLRMIMKYNCERIGEISMASLPSRGGRGGVGSRKYLNHFQTKYFCLPMTVVKFVVDIKLDYKSWSYQMKSVLQYQFHGISADITL